jgi:hypothetical protein
MFNQVSYNIVIERLKAFASGHLLIKQFTHGDPVNIFPLLTENNYPLMHVTPTQVSWAPGERSFSFTIVFADIPRDKETAAEYQREIVSDCLRLAEDLLAEIKNGGVIFGDDVTLDTGAQATPFMAEYTHTLTGIQLTIGLTFPWNWSACEIPADWAPGGSGSGGSGGGFGLVLKVNSVNNVLQNLLNIVDGVNTTVTDLGDGRVQIDAIDGAAAAWGSITGTLSSQTDLQNALDLKADISSLTAVAFSGDYNDLTNLPTIPAAQVNSDWNSNSGVSEILNKPTIPAAQIQSDWNQANNAALDFIKNKPSIPSVLNDLTDVNTAGQAADDLLTYDGAQWEPITPKNFAAKLSIENIGDVDIIAPLNNGQLLTWNSTTSQWENKTLSGLPPSGAAGGDLTGTYPNPTVHKVHGVDLQSGTPSVDETWVYGGSPNKWQHQHLSASQVINNSGVSGSRVDDALDNLETAIGTKQDTLVSGINIRTVNGNTLLGSTNIAVEPTITATTSADYYRGDKTFQPHNIASITDATDVGKNLVKLSNPSAIRYLRINADNTVSAISSGTLISDLGIATTLVLAKDNSIYSHTGNTTNTLVWSQSIAPNTFVTNDLIEWIMQLNTNTPNGTNVSYRIYINTSSSLTGATLLGTLSNSVGTGNAGFQRNIFVTATGSSGNLRVFPTASSASLSYTGGSLNASNITVDTTVTQYFIVAIQNGNNTAITSVQGNMIRLTR